MRWRVKTIDQQLNVDSGAKLHPSLTTFQLLMFGVGTVIGTGIFVLTSEAAQKAGPAMLISFLIAALVCACASLCYAEMAAMVPVAGSAYTYTYSVIGEHVAWLVGWALILEYSLAAGAISVGWAGYLVSLLAEFDMQFLPTYLRAGPADGGVVNLPPAILVLSVTALLTAGTRASARLNTVLVGVKLAALTAFIVLTWQVAKLDNFAPFAPLGGAGIGAAAASIFFAYIGFDAVATAAEETRNPQKSMPIGIVGSLLICTLIYLLVAGGVVGAAGAQPLRDAAGSVLMSGTEDFANACRLLPDEVLVCSRDPLAFVLRRIGWPEVGNMLALAVAFALPSVVLLTIYGQTRIFFAMARDGLLPSVFARVHPRLLTPHVITCATGAFVAVLAAFVPLGRLAELANAGTLFAFLIVAVAVLAMRRVDPSRHRPFRVSYIWIIAPLAAVGCLYLLVSLPAATKLLSLGWALVGIIVYLLYGYRNSKLAGRT